MRWWRWVVLAALAGLVGYSGWRTWRAFRDRPPEQFGLREHRSPAPARAVRRQFDEFMGRVRRAADRSGLPLRSIQFIELTADPRSAIYWTDEELQNPGFAPMPSFQRHSGGRQQELIGFYTLDGERLRFGERTDPKHPERRYLTVELADPVAPGQTGMILRRERRPANLKDAPGGAHTLNLGRWPVTANAVHVRGAWLPADATLLSYLPEPATTVVLTPPAFVGWLSDPADTAPLPVTVTFRRKSSE